MAGQEDFHEALRDQARRFADQVVRPAAGELDRTQRFPQEIYTRMAGLGLFGITLPEADGGLGADALAYALIMEELSRGYSSVADQCGLIELVGTLISTYGSPEQKERYLAPMLGCEKLCAYCLTEPEAGSDLASLKSTATRSGAGWRLNGSKIWIHNAPIADFGVAIVRTDPAAGHRGMSVFLVDLKAPGVSAGPPEDKMGQRASKVGALTFDDVELGPDALLGTEGRGFHMMMSVLEKGRVGIAALAVGIAQAGLEAAVDYARARRQFGQPIASFQGLQWLLADMATDIQAARLLVHDAARTLDATGSARIQTSMAKRFASDVAVARTSDAVQVFGGSGYIRGFEVERLYRDAKITQIYEGTNQIQRTIIAKELLKQ